MKKTKSKGTRAPKKVGYTFEWGPLRAGTREDRKAFLEYFNDFKKEFFEQYFTEEAAKILRSWMEDAWYFSAKRERNENN
jgi:hypothetical protein